MAGGESLSTKNAYAHAIQVGTPASKRQRSNKAISFSDVNVESIRAPHDDTIVISMITANYNIKKILIDNRSLNLPMDRL